MDNDKIFSQLKDIHAKYKIIIIEDDILKHDFDELLGYIKSSISLSKAKLKKIIDHLIMEAGQDAIEYQLMDDENFSPSDDSKTIHSEDFFELKSELADFYQKIK